MTKIYVSSATRLALEEAPPAPLPKLEEGLHIEVPSDWEAIYSAQKSQLLLRPLELVPVLESLSAEA